MAAIAWKINGQYYETCNCDFVCPCVPSQLTARPTKGSCTFAMAFQIERGDYGGLSLDGLGFILLGLTPQEMGKGNWSVGLIVDDRASAQQRDALAAIGSGSAGGPIAGLAGLVSKFLGLEPAPIRFERDGMKWAVRAAQFVDMAAEGAKGLNPGAPEPMWLENTGHPAADRFALAHPSTSRVHALGLSWDDTTGRNNGQYAPFSWKSA